MAKNMDEFSEFKDWAAEELEAFGLYSIRS